MKRSIRVGIFATLSILGLSSLGTGTYLQLVEDNQHKDEQFALIIEDKIITKVIAEEKKEEPFTITTKEVILILNQELERGVTNYIEETLTNEEISRLSIDLNQIDVTKVGTYEYKIKDLKTGTEWTNKIIVKEEEIETPPEQDLTIKLTLKNQTFKLNETLPTTISTYIDQELTEEQLKTVTLDLSEVNMAQAGSYQYTIVFQNQIYLGKITIVEDQPPLNQPTEKPDPSTPETPDPPVENENNPGGTTENQN